MLHLLAFFVVTYAVSWSLWMAAAVITGPSSDSGGMVTGAVFRLGVVAPSIIALALTATSDGRRGVGALLARIGYFPSRAWWYVFAVGYMAAVKVLVAILHRLSFGDWPRFGNTPIYLMLGAVILSAPVQAGEEIGWRGFALPRLAERIGLPGATIVLGIAWASWHLPLFFILSGDTLHQSFPLYLLQVTALSVAFGWLYWRTGGSLFLVMLLHAAVNNTKDIVPSAASGAIQPFTVRASPVGWLTLALLWLCAAWFLYRMRAADVSGLGFARSEHQRPSVLPVEG